MIQIEGLSKSFGDVQAVKDVSFSVGRGELFAFLGINGAGKSTTINIMCGQLKKDGGSVLIDGKDIDKDGAAVKREIGVVFQGSLLDGSLTVRDNLESRAALYGICGKAFDARLEELSGLLDLSELYKRTVSKLSGGQRRRVDIARALIHHPTLLILDEPTTGLDPQTRQRLWSVITDLRKREGMTVLLTTHYMEEAAEADQVVIIDAGRVVAHGTPLELKKCYSGDFITLYGTDEDTVRSLGKSYEKISGAYRLSVANTAEATALITSHPDVFVDYEIIKGRMDDVFLAATGKMLSGGEEK